MSIRTAESSQYLPAADANYDREPMGAGGPGAQPSDSFSLIDRFSNFDGTFHSNRDLRIEGEVKGTIECQGTLFIAQGANVTAKVEAENISVAGDLNGDIRCRGRLQLMPSGRLRGKVTTETLVINEGAYYEGQLEMASPDERLKPPSPRPLPSLNATPSGDAGTGGDGRPGRGSSSSNAAEGSNGPSNTFIRRFGGPETPWENRNGEDESGSKPPREP